jgi:hypothetical protein
MINIYLVNYIQREALDYVIIKLLISLQKNLQIPQLTNDQRNMFKEFINTLTFNNTYTFDELTVHLQLIINKITELIYGVNYNVNLSNNLNNSNFFSILINYQEAPFAVLDNLENITNNLFVKLTQEQYNLLLNWISNRLIYVINNNNILTYNITQTLYNELMPIIPTITYNNFDNILRTHNYSTINHLFEIFIKLLNPNDNTNNIII